MRFLSSLLCLTLAISTAACAGDSIEDGAEDVDQADLTALTGTYLIEPQANKPKDDMVFGLEFVAGKKVRALYGYEGSSYITTSCLGTYRFVGRSPNRSFEIRCPSGTATLYPVSSIGRDALVLKTPEAGESYTLRNTRGVVGSPRITCTHEKFTATIDVVGGESNRRLLLATKSKTPPRGQENGWLFNIPQDGVRWIESNGKGIDLDSDPYELKLPNTIPARFSAVLTYTDELQFYPQASKHTMECERK
jgi:hypothetical protein